MESKSDATARGLRPYGREQQGAVCNANRTAINGYRGTLDSLKYDTCVALGLFGRRTVEGWDVWGNGLQEKTGEFQ